MASGNSNIPVSDNNESKLNNGKETEPIFPTPNEGASAEMEVDEGSFAVDGFERIQNGLNSDSDLLQYLTLDDFTSGTFDELVEEMDNVTLDGGVTKKVVRSGDPYTFVPELGNIWMHFITFVEGHDEPIDSSENLENLPFYKMGSGGLILGAELALKTMSVGEISKFVFQPNYAYGQFGIPFLIPQNSRIMMAIELVKVSTEANPRRVSAPFNLRDVF